MTKYKVNKQLNTFSQDIEMIIDSREQEFAYILSDYFARNKIKSRIQKLQTGDNSFIYRGQDYRSLFSVDRKRNIDELISNFCEERFYKELDRAIKFKYFSFIIESGNLSLLYSGKYRSSMKKKSAIGIFESWTSRGIHFEFIDGLNYGNFLIWKIYYFLRNELLH